MVARFHPALKLEVASVDITEKLSANALSFVYNDHEKDDADSVSFTLFNAPAFAVPCRGDPVAAWIGWKETGLRFLGRFIVDEISVKLAGGGAPASMSVTAKSADFSKGAGKVKRSRQWEDVSLADIAARIAAEEGCASKTVGVSLVYRSVAQSNESNLHLLRRLCAEAGLRFGVKDRTFVISAPEADLRGAATLSASEVSSGSFTFADRGRYGSVTARWWDAELAREQAVTAGGGTPVYTIRKTFQSTAEAWTAARNKLTELQRGQIEGTVTLMGREDLFAGTILTLADFSPSQLNGDFMITNCIHNISPSSGFTTTLKLETIPKSNK
ncbi:phage late control D family protein [Pyramidobacter sp. CG50-2]|uniref:phage late control D family protein n=1 Tax=Pyramidobacter sp. CG50-2 TaxID=2382160 RepID=UPI000EA330B2|nr:contractile injection system protein, VgrG/Pvc8 family [Pyramidobacter sp. CG50-2]RKJ80514.1 hypothetical protein D7D26_02790 [Pyramidobacter sp. CG50-2]